MIYILAAILPPLALLIEGRLLSAIVNVVLVAVVIVLFVLTLFSVPALLLVPSIHAIVAIAQGRRRREHQELVAALREGRGRID